MLYNQWSQDVSFICQLVFFRLLTVFDKGSCSPGHRKLPPGQVSHKKGKDKYRRFFSYVHLLSSLNPRLIHWKAVCATSIVWLSEVKSWLTFFYMILNRPKSVFPRTCFVMREIIFLGKTESRTISKVAWSSSQGLLFEDNAVKTKKEDDWALVWVICAIFRPRNKKQISRLFSSLFHRFFELSIDLSIIKLSIHRMVLIS